MSQIDEIQKQLDEARKAGTAKGLRTCRTEFSMNSDERPRIHLWWEDTGNPYSGHRGFDTIEELFAYIKDLPSVNERRRDEFLSELGRVIDLGRQNSIDVEFLNPLVATMKRISENAITDQRSAA